MSRDCSITRNMNEAELDALIESRRATMPHDATRARITRAELERVLANDRRLTALEIARQLKLTTRAVQQVVCSAIGNTVDRYLSREKSPGESQYRYFLIGAERTAVISAIGGPVVKVVYAFDAVRGEAVVRFADGSLACVKLESLEATSPAGEVVDLARALRASAWEVIERRAA